MNKLNLCMLLGALTLSSLTIKADIESERMADKWSIESEYDAEAERELIGEFTLTFYCHCEICNGKWVGQPTKSGEPLNPSVTIAVDDDVIPLGTWVDIDGFGTFKSQDTGSAIKGNKIDVLVENHKKALRLGVRKNVKVYKRLDK